MANYNRNSDLPGAKKVLASESVAPQGSSAFPALIPVVVDTKLSRGGLYRCRADMVPG